MKKIISILIAFILVAALSACTDNEAISNLLDDKESIQNQVDASNIAVEDLKAANTAIQTEIDQLKASLEDEKLKHTEYQTEISMLQDDLSESQELLTDAIDTLANDVNFLVTEQVSLLSTSMIEQIAAIETEFSMTLDDITVGFNAELANAQLDFEEQLELANNQIAQLLEELEELGKPIIYGKDTCEVAIFEMVDCELSAFDVQDGDVSHSITAVTPVIINQPGEYPVLFEATDSEGNIGEYTVLVTAVIPENVVANYTSGVDLSNLDAANKARLFAAVERYLLDNVYGGVPLYTNASYAIYSDRVQLFTEQYNGVLGFGNDFSQLVLDDSSYLMFDDENGNVDEYTWRESYKNDPYSLNPWTADDSASSEFISLFTAALYKIVFDDSKTGFDIVGELASSEPIPVEPNIVDGKEVATKWIVPIEEDLVWSYHPDTDLSALPLHHEVLDAEDFIYTFKYALDNEWFRAVSGGGDFITQGIKNAEEYVLGNVTFEEVGLKVVDGMLEFEYTTPKSAFDIMYSMTHSYKPIHQQLLEAVGPESYAQSPETVASCGVYIFDQWLNNQVLTFVKNDNYVNKDWYHYTGLEFHYAQTDVIAFDLFENGKLDYAVVPYTRVEEFLFDNRIVAIPGTTVWRLMINAFGTEENRDEYIANHPDITIDDEYTPEPILMYLEMRQALQYGVDRENLAIDIAKTYLPHFTLFASTYFFDGESGMTVRGTLDGAKIEEDFGKETFGYLPDVAVAYFKTAVSKAIADGHYAAGTSESYTIIDLSLSYMSSGNEKVIAMMTRLKEQYETILVDDEHFVRVNIILDDTSEGISSFYSKMLTASTDLSLGGLSPSIYHLTPFLDIYRDDNISGFTTNWGIDTSSVKLDVIYKDADGVTRNETWSYNALVTAMNQEVYIKDGTIQTTFESVEALVMADLDINELNLTEIIDGSNVGNVYTGQNEVDFALQNNVDNIHYKIVKTEDSDFLYIISENNNEFKLLEKHGLFTNALDAIKEHSGYPGYFLDATGPMTDEDVQLNEYLTSLGTGFTTINEYVVDSEANSDYAELWNCNWDGWSDVYIILHVGEYYLGWEWL